MNGFELIRLAKVFKANMTPEKLQLLQSLSAAGELVWDFVKKVSFSTFAKNLDQNLVDAIILAVNALHRYDIETSNLSGKIDNNAAMHDIMYRICREIGSKNNKEDILRYLQQFTGSYAHRTIVAKRIKRESQRQISGSA